MYAGGGKTDEGLPFQYTWSEQEKRNHINWLELRAERRDLQKLAGPGDVAELNMDNIMNIAFIRIQGGGCASNPYIKRAKYFGKYQSGEGS